jgi:mannose-6-phosphate isomerase-like protein (cupin superfamily)
VASPIIPNLFTDPIHLGLGAKAVVEPAFTGMPWYEDYGARHAADGAEGRLVGMYRFTESWDSWECHPHGDEVVLCVAGAMTLHQETPDGETVTVTLGPGDYAINPPGIWHTADIEGEATALFITSGLGTIHRPR